MGSDTTIVTLAYYTSSLSAWFDQVGYNYMYTLASHPHIVHFVPKGAAWMVSQSALLLVLLALATCSEVAEGEHSSTAADAAKV